MKKKNVFVYGIFAVAMIVTLTFTVCSEASDNSSGSVAVIGITLNQSSLSLTVGSTAPLTATVLPSNANNKNVSWSSSNTGVATVNNGTVTAVAAGSATITVTTTDGGYTATCAVTVTAQGGNNNQVTPITVADITITGPSKGAVPATTVVSEAERFTAGTVTWSPNDNPFKGGEVYTATVTLTAKSGFTFQGLLDANVKVNGETATTVTRNADGTITLSYTFAATNTKTISSIAIKTQPNNLTYTHGDKLDLSGLVITLTYDDTTTEDVPASGFTAKNIATNPGHDTPLERSISNGHPVTISIGGETANTNNLTVSPGNASAFTIDAITAQTYTGSAITPTITVNDGTRTLTLTTDYTVAYSNNTNSGTNTATVTITGTGDYTGTKEITFTINKANPSITAWPTAAEINSGAALSTSALTGGVSTPSGTFAWTDGTTVPPAGTSAYGVTFTPTDTANYNTATGTVSVSVTIRFVEMVSISAGTFNMGQTGVETPVHSVTLSGFKMGKYLVTQEQYQAVMGSNPSRFTSAVEGESGTPGKLPVENVNWYDALVFCNKLSVMEGLSPAYRISGSTDPAAWGTMPTFPWDPTAAIWDAVEVVSDSTGYRLPTEAQWEYACRAGTTTAYNTGTTISDNTGWYNSNSGSKTHQVGLKQANAWGLYDMHGNLAELCWDWYGGYASGTQIDPTGAVAGDYRVLRGGHWKNDGQDLRSAQRSFTNSEKRDDDRGFRLVLP